MSLLSSPQGSETDVGNLGRGQYLMVVEETADRPVPFGEPTEGGQQPTIEIPPSTTTDHRT